MGLLSLPDEVLEITLKCLLPPFRSQSLAETYVFTIPVDLLATRLVSRRLHCIATPFAWRRAQLQIASPAAKYFGSYDERGKRTGSDALLTATRHSLRSLARCRFFYDHPELAAHVRVLLVSIEWHADAPELAREALKNATRAMTNLRTVLVWDADVLPFIDIRQLLERPLLRAVRLMDVDGSAFPAHADWGAGLKMLHIANSVCPARLITGAAAALECVSIELARKCPAMQSTVTLRDMPWKTLREVALVDCVDDDDWALFLDGFMSHRRLGHSTVLRELMIGDLGGLEPTRISELLHAFSGQPLFRLTLYHVLVLDPPTLAQIVYAFPLLQDLTLLTEGGLTPWPGKIDEYARELAGLSHLTTLAWNNFSLDPALDAAFPTLSDMALGTLYAEHARALTKRICGLQRVRLTSVTDGVVDTVWVKKRNPLWTIDVKRSTDVFLHTSSWSTASGAFEDI